MSSRKVPFVNREIYHIFNKTIDNKKVFAEEFYSKEFYNRLLYYRSTNATKSFSHLKLIKKEYYNKIYSQVRVPESFNISILNYSLMPNHFHLLVMQHRDNGITSVMSKTLNSFTRYYNSINNRSGQVFLRDFKAIKINGENQLIHSSRYIDLNSFSSGITKKVEKIEDFKWCGYRSYLKIIDDPLVETAVILGLFDGNTDKYKKFVLDRAVYQRELELIKHALKL